MALFGTSGIRRKFDHSLLEIGMKAGLALGHSYTDVVIGRDTRTSGNALHLAVIAGLLSAGARCHDTGTVPTPTLALATRRFKAGVMITASHNPPEYNGIKVFNPDGSSFDTEQQGEIEASMRSDTLSAAAWGNVQTACAFYEGAVGDHIKHVLDQTKVIAKARVVLDCGGGAGSVITPYLLQTLGCEALTLNSQPTGFFPHDIEPIEKNLTDLMRITRELGAIGIAHDGDADRMMAVDEKGRFVPGDKLLVLLARQTGAKDVVTTVDASMIIEEAGFQVRRTKVGDTFVSEQLRYGGDFGGEPSGAWVFPRSSLCPDGIYAAAALLELAGQERLSDMVDSIPQYPVIRGNLPADGVSATAMKECLTAMRPVSMDESDGLKLVFADGWLLVRLSGTEPKIRITAEAKTEARARELYDSATKAIRN